MTRAIFTSAMSPLELPDVIMRSEAVEAYGTALALFNATFGESSTLPSDLDLAERLFDPVAQGQRLRREIESLPSVSDNRVFALPSSWVLQIAADKVVLTPEGISGMHALRAALAANPERAIEMTEHSGAAVAVLLDRYRRWARHRLNGVVRLLSGTDKPLQVQGAGLLIALLVNRNFDERDALSRAGVLDGDKRDAIDRAFDRAVRAFGEALAPGGKVKSGGDRLISGWKLGEIARRLGGGLVVTAPTQETPGRVYVRSDRRESAIDLIARDLARGNRRIPTLLEFQRAFDKLVGAFLAERMTLASFGELHENARETELLRAELSSAFERHLEARA